MDQDTFRSLYQRSADVAFRAPGRVNCIGDHTDYQGGLSLPIAISLATTVCLGWRDDAQVAIASEFESERWTGSLLELHRRAQERPLRGLYGFVVAAVDLLSIERGFNLSVTSTLPAGSGLSSSAALALSLIACLTYPQTLSPAQLIPLAQTVENQYLGVRTGILDQTAITYAKAGQAVLIDAGQRSAETIPFDFAGAGYRFWIIDTKTPRSLAASAYDTRVDESQEASQVLCLPSLRQAAPGDWQRIADPVLRRRARHIITENLRVQAVVEAAGRNDWAHVAELLSESHQSLRDDYEVSTPILDRTVEAVLSIQNRLAQGKAGARLTGAGFGGSVVALLPEAASSLLHDALEEAFEPTDCPVATAVDQAGEGLKRLLPK